MFKKSQDQKPLKRKASESIYSKMKSNREEVYRNTSASILENSDKISVTYALFHENTNSALELSNQQQRIKRQRKHPLPTSS